jgi:hypothetical protein
MYKVSIKEHAYIKSPMELCGPIFFFGRTTLTGKKSGTLKKIHLYLSMYVIFLSQKFIFVLFPILHNFLLIYWVLPFNC